MALVSTSELSRLTGMTRETVGDRLDGLKSTAGDKGAKMYDSTVVLPILYGVNSGQMTNTQANLELNIAKRKEIELSMESIRKERIPLEIVSAVNDETHTAIANQIKANEGKILTPEIRDEIFAELRAAAVKIRERTQ